tara:strand:+ start:3600 stop:4034 length:435 start_codon:yes stop_codon:yes gene_type:complete
MSKTSYRENIAKDIAKQIKSIKSVRYVDRDVFDPDEISDAQFPAVLIQSGSETKSDISMGYDRKGDIEYIITAFVKGKYIDSARNKILDEIEEKLYENVSRDGYAIDTLVTEINTDEGVLYPLGAIQIIVRVEYIHQKGDLDKG